MDLSINDALEIIDKAAREGRRELVKLLSTRYLGLKELILAGEVAKNQKDAVLEVASAIDRKAHEKPWYFMAGALFLGLLMGRKK